MDNKKEQSPDTHDSVNKSQNHYVMWKEPNRKAYERVCDGNVLSVYGDGGFKGVCIHQSQPNRSFSVDAVFYT